MDAPQTNLGPEPRSHTGVMVTLAVIITLIVAGGGIYAWQYLVGQEKDTTIQKLEQQVDSLSAQIIQLQQESNNIQQQAEEDKSLSGFGTIGPAYALPYSIAGENHQLLATESWGTYNNQAYNYSFKFDNTQFNCTRDESVQPFDENNNKLPEGEIIDLNTRAENMISCVAVESCVIQEGFIGCVPMQIKISVYSNTNNLSLNEFCNQVGYTVDDCSAANYQLAGSDAIRNSFRLVPIDNQEPQSEDDIVDYIHFSLLIRII